MAALAGAEGAGPRKSDEPFEAKWRVTVRRTEVGRAGEVTEVVEIGAPDASGDVVVRRALDGARLHVAAAVARKLVPRAVALRGAEVWAPAIEGVPVAPMETRCDGVAQVVVHDGDAWTMRTPAGFAADNASILELIDAVTRARAESWVADADDGHFGFEGAPCSVALDAPRGRRRARGAHRARARRRRAASTRARAKVPPSSSPEGDLRDRARGWLVDLHGFARRERWSSVTLVRDGKRRAFGGADAGLTRPTDAVLAAANVLRADSVVHLGPAARADEGLRRARRSSSPRAPAGVGRRSGSSSARGPRRTARAATPAWTGVDATFAVERDRVKAFFDRF